jgi:hypothetical protein
MTGSCALYSSPNIRVIKSGRQIDKECSTYGGEYWCVQGFSDEASGKEASSKTQAYMGG